MAEKQHISGYSEYRYQS